MRSPTSPAPRSRSLTAAPRPDQSRSQPPVPEHGRAAPPGHARPAGARSSSAPGTSRLPLQWLVPAAGERRSAERPSADRQSPRAVARKQQCYFSSSAYRSFGRFGQASTRLDTPPFSHRHHPVSAIAPFEHIDTQVAQAFAAQWLAYALPYRRFADTLASANARLGADADRYSSIVGDFYLLLFAGFDRRAERSCPADLNNGRCVQWPHHGSDGQGRKFAPVTCTG